MHLGLPGWFKAEPKPPDSGRFTIQRIFEGLLGLTRDLFFILGVGLLKNTFWKVVPWSILFLLSSKRRACFQGSHLQCHKEQVLTVTAVIIESHPSFVFSINNLSAWIPRQNTKRLRFQSLCGSELKHHPSLGRRHFRQTLSPMSQIACNVTGDGGCQLDKKWLTINSKHLSTSLSGNVTCIRFLSEDIQQVKGSTDTCKYGSSS